MTDAWPATAFAHLVPGRSYRVVQSFRDFDGQDHAIGESWTFMGSSFVPYDDGLSFFVTMDGQRRQIRMQWREGAQATVIDNLADYVHAKN